MASKPVHLARAGGIGNRQKVWNFIRSKAKPTFTLDDLEHATKISRKTIFSYVQGLRAAGHVEVDTPSTKIGMPVTYRMGRDNGVDAPRVQKDGTPVTQGLGNEQMWHTMRRMHEFNSRELAAWASTPEAEVTESTAAAYIGALLWAGYLVCVQPAKLSAKQHCLSRYSLVKGKYTGPRAPMIQRTKTVYDPNLGKVVWTEEIDPDA